MRLILLLALVCACGPSARQVALAKTARYHGDKYVLFQGMKLATQDKYRLAFADETTLTLVTVSRWFTPEGTASAWNPGDTIDTTDRLGGQPSIQGREKVPDRSINVRLTVRLLPEGYNWVVHVEPRYLQLRTGRSNLDLLLPDDPSLPGWAHGKVDQLAYAIYDTLKKYEVKVASRPQGPEPEYVPPPEEKKTYPPADQVPLKPEELPPPPDAGTEQPAPQ